MNQIEPVTSDCVSVAITRDSVTSLFLLHKSDTCIAMDSNWLMNPTAAGETAAFIQAQRKINEHQINSGGSLKIDFDHRVIESNQTYRHVDLFSMDEFGFHCAAAPIWMNWRKLIQNAFLNICMKSVIYQNESISSLIEIELPDGIKSNFSSVLRFSSRQNKGSLKKLGVRYSPPGWRIDTGCKPI